MPPYRMVNHKILLIDQDKQYCYHLPQCLNALRDKFDEKVNQSGIAVSLAL